MRVLFKLEDDYGLLENEHVLFDSLDPDSVAAHIPIDTVLKSISEEALTLALDAKYFQVNVDISLQATLGGVVTDLRKGPTIKSIKMISPAESLDDSGV